MKKQAVKDFYKILKDTYPDATCSLDFKTPFQIVVAVMLSAQCTDERVNKTTPALFERCKTIQDFADIDIKQLEDIYEAVKNNSFKVNEYTPPTDELSTFVERYWKLGFEEYKKHIPTLKTRFIGKS